MNFWKALLLAAGLWMGGHCFAADVDLSRMNSTMLFARLYEISETAIEYKGKTFRVNGYYQLAKDEIDGKTYHVLLLSDAAACCNFSFEIEWLAGEKIPKKGSRITVEGTFNPIFEENVIIPQLKKARIVP